MLNRACGHVVMGATKNGKVFSIVSSRLDEQAKKLEDAWQTSSWQCADIPQEPSRRSYTEREQTR